MAAGEGDAASYEQLVRSTRGWAVAHAYALLRDPARAEECVQQAHLEIWQTATRYDPTRGGAKSWILSLVRHRALDEIRRSESERRRVTAFELRVYPATRGYEDETTEVAHARLDGYVVREALARLKDHERQVLELSYWSGLSHSQIATQLGLPLGTVKYRIRASLLKLRPHVS